MAHDNLDKAISADWIVSAGLWAFPFPEQAPEVGSISERGKMLHALVCACTFLGSGRKLIYVFLRYLMESKN